MTTTATGTSAATTTATVASVLDPSALLIAHANLTGTARLLDPAQLGELVGHPAAPTRIRVKTEVSLLVAHRAAPTAAHQPMVDEVGWALLVRAADKRDGVLRRAARTGATVIEHDFGDEPFLLTGALDADPRLGKAVSSVLRKHRGEQRPRVLSYNPARHVVLELSDTRQVLRIAGRPLSSLQAVTDTWLDVGLPTLAQHRWKGRATVLVGEHWGDGDLTTARADDANKAARRVGEHIAALHAATTVTPELLRGLPAARTGALIPATLAALTGLLPYRTAQVHRLGELLRHRLPATPHTGLIHGDLTPCQVLVSGDDLRIIDLDRSGLGPLGADLGSWIAWSLAHENPSLAGAFFDGYAQAGAPFSEEELAAWTARALLAGALDPMRRCAPQWLIDVERRLDLAEAILDSPELLARLRAPSVSETIPQDSTEALGATVPEIPSAPGTAVPEAVEHEGRTWRVRRAWADDGRGLPLELETSQPAVPGSVPGVLRGARLDTVTGAVTVFAPGRDPRLPGLGDVLANHPGSVVVSHRPGKRAVVRVPDPADGTGDGADRFIKIVRPGKAGRIVAAIDRASTFDGPFRTPRVLTHDEQSVTFAALPGHSLHDPLPVIDGTWQHAWRDVLAAWASAVTGGSAPAAEQPGPLHGPAQEITVLGEWRDRAAAVDPGGAAARDEAVQRAVSALERVGPPRGPVPIHRDLHDKQLLWHPADGPGLLDVDTAATGDPALDLANLRAHATWRQRQGLWTAAHTRIVHEQIDAAVEHVGLPAAVLTAYELGSLARLTCVYAFRPRWQAAARHLADELAARTAVPGPPTSDPIPPRPPVASAPIPPRPPVASAPIPSPHIPSPHIPSPHRATPAPFDERK